MKFLDTAPRAREFRPAAIIKIKELCTWLCIVCARAKEVVLQLAVRSYTITETNKRPTQPDGPQCRARPH